MADIISIRSHPSWGSEPLSRIARGEAGIIMFPGVRYERTSETQSKKKQAAKAPQARTGEKGKRKSRA